MTSPVSTEPRNRWRVTLTEPIHAAAMDRLGTVADIVVAASTAPDDVIAACVGADALIVRSSRLGADIIEACGSLRVIGRHGVGTENIDRTAAEAAGIEVVATPGANAHSVAEFVLLTTMMLARRLPAAVTALESGDLSGGTSLPGAVVRAGLVGSTLSERSFGIVGMGAIGREVAAMAGALGARCVGHDPYVPAGDAPVEMLDGLELAERSDVVTLHLPVTEQTRNFVDEDFLARLRPGSLLINTARAEVVDKDAVLRALDAGRLGGYAVDTFVPEPPTMQEPLLHHRGVLATPHMAAMTNDALRRMADAVVDGVLGVLNASDCDATLEGKSS